MTRRLPAATSRQEGRAGLVAVATHPDVDIVLCPPLAPTDSRLSLRQSSTAETIAPPTRKQLLWRGGIVTDTGLPARRARDPGPSTASTTPFISACTARGELNIYGWH